MEINENSVNEEEPSFRKRPQQRSEGKEGRKEKEALLRRESRRGSASNSNPEDDVSVCGGRGRHTALMRYRDEQ